MNAATIIISWVFFCTLFTTNAQLIEGSWSGLLETHGIKLRLVFNVEKTLDGYQATLDSPDQGAKGIKASKVSFEDKTLIIEVALAGLKYQGTLHQETIKGNLVQFGMELPLNLSRGVKEAAKMVRPQEPLPPFPYRSEDVRFFNQEAGIFLAGTLASPFEGNNMAAVVLVTGSGSQNRDEEILGHKPFLVISDYLARNGIAVLRFDDRGVAESEGDFQTATSRDFATDVASAIRFLKSRPEINPAKIGIAGHSEGGLVAAIVAAKHPEMVAFVVSLAGPGVRGDQIILAQQQLIGKAQGVDEAELLKAAKINQQIFAAVMEIEDNDILTTEIETILTRAITDGVGEIPQGLSHDDFLAIQLAQISNPWMLFFLRHDPSKDWQRVKCPVLALNGKNDLQVPAGINLGAIRDAVMSGGNEDITTILLPGLNHLFQECESGSPSNYGTISQTFSPQALEIIEKWINERFGK